MISGAIHPEDSSDPGSGDARVILSVGDSSGVFHPIGFMIDTGFSGYLTLPATIVEQLGLPWFQRMPGELAEREERAFDIYRAVVRWNEKNQVVSIVRSETQPPLLGMAMLWGSRLIIEVKEGGTVSIEELTEA